MKIVKKVCLLGLLSLTTLTQPCVVGVGSEGNSIQYCIEGEEEDALSLVEENGSESLSSYLANGFDDCVFSGYESVN